MNKGCATTHGSVAAMLIIVAPWAFGQSMYRCNNGAAIYFSDRPCQGAAPSAELRAIGPVPERAAYGRDYTPALPKAPDILPYLSPECAQMNDAVRTGPTRGLKGAAMSELTTNYRARCSEDEQQANQRMSQARSDARQQRKIAQASHEAAVARERLTVDQCNEMLRILAAKRQRSTRMTPGEQQDLGLFETNYRARCKSG